VHPDRGQHRTDALRDHGHVRDRDAVFGGDMVHEGLHVAHGGPETGAETPLAGRAAVTARIPGEDGEVGQVELV
jgi:hypothetical protein